MVCRNCVLQISACHKDDSVQGKSAPNTPRQSPTDSRPAKRVTPTSSSEVCAGLSDNQTSSV